MNKKVFACLLAVVMLLGMIVVPAAAKAEGEEPAKEIVVLYTNDVHCGVTDGMGYVGVARVKAALEAAGKEVILVDTGLPAGTPEESPDEKSVAFTGRDICSYMDALAAIGYKPEQVTKILLTHRHSDHSGELRSFPAAKIYVNAEELDAAELQGIPNLVPVHFTDGATTAFEEADDNGVTAAEVVRTAYMCLSEAC